MKTLRFHTLYRFKDYRAPAFVPGAIDAYEFQHIRNVELIDLMDDQSTAQVLLDLFRSSQRPRLVFHGYIHPPIEVFEIMADCTRDIRFSCVPWRSRERFSATDAAGRVHEVAFSCGSAYPLRNIWRYIYVAGIVELSVHLPRWAHLAPDLSGMPALRILALGLARNGVPDAGPYEWTRPQNVRLASLQVIRLRFDGEQTAVPVSASWLATFVRDVHPELRLPRLELYAVTLVGNPDEVYPLVSEMSFQDGNIFLLLGTTIFKLHREMLTKKSAYFKDALAAPQAGNAFYPGESEQHPLAVPDVLPSAFIQLIGIIYGRRKLRGPPGVKSHSRAATADIVALIRAAHKLKFNDILKQAVSCYEHSLQAATRLALALSCNIDAWAAPAFAQIVLSFESNAPNPNPYGLLKNPDILPLVYLARQEVAKARLQHITHRGFEVLGGRNKGQSPVAFVDALVITRVLPFTSRATFCKAFAAHAEQMAEEFKISGPRWEPTKAQLEQWVPNIDDEVKLVEALWHYKSPNTMEVLFE
ncbi:hypothetical protein AURDEDRAFT_175436 [Auricularia subglabra TFB-10046 SS5]|uniref:BTB domain-containing protein n=1 Tax=Auricularia subglabra (strain TFB-10046 / SS5) TaxID=717982 RepID=J0D8F9_AURST|nr:hypothetical protein AURDEDRAFT_175436 [Auricularia subglabra TFB-10046 SS5]